MAEHTKGNLSILLHTEHHATIEIYAGEHQIIDGRNRADWIASIELQEDKPYEECAANARRLVACWNACEAFTTEAIEGGIVMRCYEESFTLDGEGDAPKENTDG